ncbi:Hsp70 family protein [bacterium]|nr:Hsp70 family protein [candidate division CSSED10-310 bacterium]
MKTIPVYGIDFGTTNSAIAILEGGRPRILPVDRGPTMRSVLFFPEHDVETFVGNQAIEEYVNRGMEGRFLQSLKSILPSTWFTTTRIREMEYEVEDLVALILRNLKIRADAMVGMDVRRVVLGRPAYFAMDSALETLAVERLITAAQRAGFEEVRLQIEPIAAAFFYEMDLAGAETVMVADLGGGTSDFTVMRLAPNRRDDSDRGADILGTSGVRIAGDSFDAAVMRAKLLRHFGQGVRYESHPGKWLQLPSHLLGDLCEWSKIPFLKNNYYREFLDQVRWGADDPAAIARLQALIDQDLGFFLFHSIETAKCELSDLESTVIHFHELSVWLDEPITRDEFNHVIDEEMQLIEDCVDDLLQSVGLAADEIDTVFMTGGSSLVPRVRWLLQKRFGADRLRRGDTFLSVASGLAMNARLFQWQ